MAGCCACACECGGCRESARPDRAFRDGSCGSWACVWHCSPKDEPRVCSPRCTRAFCRNFSFVLIALVVSVALFVLVVFTHFSNNRFSSRANMGWLRRRGLAASAHARNAAAPAGTYLAQDAIDQLLAPGNVNAAWGAARAVAPASKVRRWHAAAPRGLTGARVAWVVRTAGALHHARRRSVDLPRRHPGERALPRCFRRDCLRLAWMHVHPWLMGSACRRCAVHVI
jgi:hypothetical protein